MPAIGLPTIVIVPGAFCKPDIFDSLLTYLKAAGFTTHLGPIPSCDPADPTVATCEADSTSLRNEVLVPLLAKGEDIVVFAHSYGGTVAGSAIKNLDKDTRKKEGKAASIIGLIYLAGIISLEGETVLQAVGGSLPPFIKIDKPAKGLSVIEPLSKHMSPHALLAFNSPALAPGWADSGFEGKRAYIRTVKDLCNPLWLQDVWLEKSKVEWDVTNLDTGHMPFLSRPEALAAEIVRLSTGLLAA
ncbi:Alpha/Beta hydrolase protein [Xylaria bambusicola]|uniref:Alpha/Beta hydrolase protein n=1 Tax=Xylaria bambusicola TaxID=326684 RepID=UPI002008850D|nr:Alpha/Beta hydrolase protein [Xylaria bambusicola]KAI0525360.1 Alpha/Beta hydrolase protein [Xylaria bambusicola]